MRFILKLLVVGILVFVSYYMFTTERFKGSPKTQVQQALGIKDKEVIPIFDKDKKDPAVEIELEEMTAKFGLTEEMQQLIRGDLRREKQQITAVLEDKRLTKQQQSEKITKIHNFYHVIISSMISDQNPKRKEIREWLMSKERNLSDSNRP
jgi:hypothetical protein